MPVIEQGTQIGFDGKRYPVGDPRLLIRPGGTSGPGPSPDPVDPKSQVRTVRVAERSNHHFSAMAPVAITEGLAQSWVVPIPADAIPLHIRVLVVGHTGDKPEVAEVSLEIQKVASGAGDLDEDSVPVKSWALNPSLTQDEDDPNAWLVWMPNHSGSSDAIETNDDRMVYWEPGWFRSIIRVRWVS
jgi:hypothetical protein